MIDGVRQAAYEQILAASGGGGPPARLELVVRSWMSLAESTALIWLDGRRIPRAELEIQLVHDFAALAAVSAAYDDGDGGHRCCGSSMRSRPTGPFGRSARAALRSRPVPACPRAVVLTTVGQRLR